MKQRIRVTSIIRNENGVLILKRNRGRSESPVFWELPTGKIKIGEQPEEALVRSLSENTGLTAKSVKLKDVITFLAPEGSSRISNLYIIYEVEIDHSAKPTLSGRYTGYKYIKDVTSSNIRLDEASYSTLEIIEGKSLPGHISPRETASAVTIYVDGASRGNPGPSGIGYHIIDANGQTIERGGEFIGFASSRVAEYYAMKNGIERAIAHGLKTARFVSDSLMVVNQLNGIFAIKNQDIIPIYNSIIDLLENFKSVSFVHVPRSENQIADAEANLAIDNLIKK